MTIMYLIDWSRALRKCYMLSRLYLYCQVQSRSNSSMHWMHGPCCVPSQRLSSKLLSVSSLRTSKSRDCNKRNPKPRKREDPSYHCIEHTRFPKRQRAQIYHLDWFRGNSPCPKITISQSESSTGLHSTSKIAWQILKLIIFVLHQPIFEVSLTAPPVVLFPVVLVVSFPVKFNCVELAFLSDIG